MASNKPFDFDINAATGRFKQLVNNEYRSDVVFKVGRTGQLIYAHKNIITIASEVFYAQFNGSFAEGTAEINHRENPVVVEDIEPEVFVMLMEYIYCDKIELTVENALGIYYASQKYMLQKLITRCETFFLKAIDESNALVMLNQNYEHQFPAIDEQCLAIIRDNPLKFFNLEFFNKINQRTMELIAPLRIMNCYKDHLLAAIDRWKEANDCKDDIVPNLEGLMKCHKLFSFSAFYFSATIETHLGLTVTKPVRYLQLYGLGIYVGAKAPVTEGKVSLKIDVKGLNEVSVCQEVQLQSEIYIHEMLFERVTITNEGSIKMTVKASAVPMELMCFNAFVPVNNLNAVGLTTTLGSNYGGKYGHCIAYLLYSEEQRDDASFLRLITEIGKSRRFRLPNSYK